MKKSYIILMFLFLGYPVFSQNENEGVSECEEADSNLIYAYSNVKSAYEANNISHLKRYSNKSLSSFRKAKMNLKNCGCEPGFHLAEKAIDLLEKVEPSETYEDGRFFVKRVREIAQESITELNKYLAAKSSDQAEEDIEEELVAQAPVKTSEPESPKNDLAALKLEQDRLEQQKLELKRKQEELEQKLASQKEKASKLAKEKLIKSYEDAMTSNVNALNDLLDLYGSSTKLTYYGGNKSQLLLKDSEAIKAFYLEKSESLTEAYLKKLKLCESK